MRNRLRTVHDALLGGDEPRRSAAREILDAIVPAELRDPLIAVVDQRRARLGVLAPSLYRSYEDVITALLADPNESVRCVGAYCVAERHLVALRGDLARLRPANGPLLVMIAFDQAIARLDV